MKATKMRLLFLLAVGFVLFVSAQAGDLEPPGAPAPTMVTLQEIYNLVQSQAGGFAIQKTGQTGCWDGAGTSIPCAGTGQDGEYQNGASVSPRFTDNGDGTVTDNPTNLIWLKFANCFGFGDWTNALSDANTLADGLCSLTDGSVVGDWRLPNVRELQSLIGYSNSLPALPTGHPFSGVQSSYYWSSTTFAGNPITAWGVLLDGGTVIVGNKTITGLVWPVRGGP